MASKCTWVCQLNHCNPTRNLDIYASSGFFESGQARLLFSSAQMDYIRYWLHAMGYTKEIVPLPYSDCLLTESDLRNVSTVVYKDGLSLKNAVKVKTTTPFHFPSNQTNLCFRRSRKITNGSKVLIPFSHRVATLSNASALIGRQRKVSGVPSILRPGNETTNS